jgi:hypothetical protein
MIPVVESYQLVDCAELDAIIVRGRRLRFASGGRDNYGERSEPKHFFARGG